MKKKTTLFRIDEKVFFTMVGVCVLSLIILGFRYATSEACYPVKLVLPSDTVLAGTRVNFKAETKGGKVFSWDFRDGTTKEEESPFVSHTFKTPGKYTISVTVNESCSEYSTLVVVKPVVEVKRIQIPMFAGPDSVNLNEPISFVDTSSLATSWEWQFEAGGAIESRNKRATYTYITPGKHLVTLTVNGRADMFTSRYIMVVDNSLSDNEIPRPRETGSRRPKIIEVPSGPTVAPITPQIEPLVPDPEPEPVRAPMISGAELEQMFLEVIVAKKTAADFSAYLCGKLEMRVSYNSTTISFTQMCIEIEKIKKKKHVKTLTVLPIRNQTTGCIESMVVTLKKKWGH